MQFLVKFSILASLLNRKLFNLLSNFFFIWLSIKLIYDHSKPIFVLLENFEIFVDLINFIIEISNFFINLGTFLDSFGQFYFQNGKFFMNKNFICHLEPAKIRSSTFGLEEVKLRLADRAGNVNLWPLVLRECTELLVGKLVFLMHPHLVGTCCLSHGIQLLCPSIVSRIRRVDKNWTNIRITLAFCLLVACTKIE